MCGNVVDVVVRNYVNMISDTKRNSLCGHKQSAAIFLSLTLFGFGCLSPLFVWFDGGADVVVVVLHFRFVRVSVHHMSRQRLHIYSTRGPRICNVWCCV